MNYILTIFVLIVLLSSCNPKANDIKDKDIAIDSFNAVVLERDNALIFARKGKFKEAYSHIEKAISLDSKNEDTLVIGATVRAMNKDYKTALASLDKLIEASPKNASAMVAKSAVLYHMENLEEALKAADKAIEVDKDNALAYSNRSAINGRLGKFEQSVKDSDKAVEITTNMPAAFTNQAASLLKLKKYDRTLAALFDSLTIKPDLGVAYYLRGQVMKDKGRKDKDNNDFARAKQLGFNSKTPYTVHYLERDAIVFDKTR